jgi:hypothetical protein
MRTNATESGLEKLMVAGIVPAGWLASGQNSTRLGSWIF